MSACLRCGQTGHFAKECSQPPTCNNCGGKGHLAKMCPAIRCDRCGKAGHMARECTRGGGNLKCYDCGEPGHVSRDCPTSQKRRKHGSFDREHIKKAQELHQYHRARAEVSKQESLQSKIGASVWDGSKTEPKAKKMRVGVLAAPVAILKRKGSESNQECAPAAQTSLAASSEGKPSPASRGEASAGNEQAPIAAPQGLGLLAGYDSASDDDDEAQG